MKTSRRNHYGFRWTIWTVWIALIALPAGAVETKVIRDDAFKDFAQGELESVAVTSDGFVQSTYARRTVGDTGAEIVWDALREADGTVLCATGHQGRLMRVIDEETSKTVAKVEEPELTALVRMADGSALAAAAPTGRIYRLDTDDALTTYTQLDAVFVWRMIADDEGAVWAVTGAGGKLFRIRDRAGQAEVEEVFTFESSNLLDLWIDREGRMGPAGDLYVAGQDPGWLYRFHPGDKKAEVIFNSQAEEVRAILPAKEAKDGMILALNTERAPTPQAIQLTLRMGGRGRRGDKGDEAIMLGGDKPPIPPQNANTVQSLSEAFKIAKERAYGRPRSEVVLLSPEGFSRTLWASPERPIHALALSPAGTVMAAAGGEGRLFEVRPNGEFSVLCDLREDYLVRIVPDSEGYLFATARNGIIFEMRSGRAADAVYRSRPLDATIPVRWGNFYARGRIADLDDITVAFRSGNDGDPLSDLWSDWTKETSVANDMPVAMPSTPARFVQYRLTFGKAAKGGERPNRIDNAEVFFVEPNVPPVLREIKVAEGSPPKPAPGAKNNKPPAGGKPGSAPAPGNPGPGVSRKPHSNTMTLKIQWAAVDPNNDRMEYALYFRSTDEEAWKLIDDQMPMNKIPLTVGGVADGRYRFRVVASDAPGNPPGAGLKTEMVSDEVVVDNTPPRFEEVKAKVRGTQATLTVELVDALSLLADLKVDIDNGDTFPLLPTDGLMDAREEKFTFETKELKVGEHVATFNATDRTGNTSAAKVVFTIK